MHRSLYILLSLIFIFCLLGYTNANSTNIAKPATKASAPVIYTIKAPKAGKLIGLIVEKGERISKGQPLFAMQNEILSKQDAAVTTEIAKEEAKLKVMQTGIPAVHTVNLTSLQNQQKAAQQKAAKMNSLYAQGGVSRKQAEAANQELEAANQALARAGNQVSTKPASKEEQESQSKKITTLKEQQNKLHIQLQANEILCPATCIVKEVNAKNGDMVKLDQIILILEETKE